VSAYGLALDALGDPTRRTIVERLRTGPLSVGELAAGLPVSRPAVSQHLAVLRRARLVRHERKGTRNVYRLDAEGVAALRAYFDAFWDDALARFADAAEKGAAS
jgi:DNA-binding transcriptional ArsR family regulator